MSCDLQLLWELCVAISSLTGFIPAKAPVLLINRFLHFQSVVIRKII